MSKLFMKVARTPGGRVFAWRGLATRTLCPGSYLMSSAEGGEFHYLDANNRHSCIGAGGQFEYKQYDIVEYTAFPYAIVKPDIALVRERYPTACRVIDLRTGQESALCDTTEHAVAVVLAARAKKLKGSFGIETV